MPKFNGPMPGAGRPRGSRNRFSKQFLEALREDFEANGAAAIRIVRVEDPARYLAIIASTLPKQLEVESNLTELDDETLDQMISALRQRVLTERQDEALKPEPMKVLAANGHSR